MFGLRGKPELRFLLPSVFAHTPVFAGTRGHHREGGERVHDKVGTLVLWGGRTTGWQILREDLAWGTSVVLWSLNVDLSSVGSLRVAKHFIFEGVLARQEDVSARQERALS